VVQQNRDVWIIIPVHNEGAVVGDVVTGVLDTFPNVVCVDDGSTDGSARQILATGAHLVSHPINMGQGAAIATGLRYALSRDGGGFFVTFDADGQHRTDDALAMIEIARSGAADVVIGSRYLAQPPADGSQRSPAARTTGAPGQSRVRRVVLRTIAVLSPTARRLKLTDTHNGLRVFTRPAAAELRITQNGMAHASEITGWLARSPWRVAEAPITVLYTDYSRGKGQSLVNGVNILFDVSMSRREVTAMVISTCCGGLGLCAVRTQRARRADVTARLAFSPSSASTPTPCCAPTTSRRSPTWSASAGAPTCCCTC
jgi:glycosyltransferase involved in cell wall biosynthesis